MKRDALWRILGLFGVPPKLINLISEQYSGTKSAVRCGGSIFNLFPVVNVVRQGTVLAPTLFNACVDWILERISERSRCGGSFVNVKISQFDFTDDSVIFAETLDILMGALETLNEVLQPLGLQLSKIKN